MAKLNLKVGGGVFILDSLETTITEKDYDPVMKENIGKVFTVKDLVQGEEGLEIYVEEKPFFFIERDVSTEGIDKLLAARKRATETIKIVDQEKPKEEGQKREETLPEIYEYLRDYFSNHITNHSSVNKVEDNSIYIHCSFRSEIPINLLEKARIDYPTGEYASNLFDGSFSTLVYEKRGDKAIEFFDFENHKLGIFFLKKKSLILTDLTHTTSGHPIVKSIVAFLVNKELLTKSEFEESAEKEVDITIGADPEFELMKDGEFVSANNYFSGCDPSVEIGVDGNSDTLELRPSPSKAGDVTEFVGKLSTLMEGVHRKIKKDKDVIVSSKGDKIPIGGHFHVGVNNSTYTPSKKLIRLLDYFLGLPFWNVSGKARGSYKKISCVVNQNWGFEYKSTPSACFANPKITGICVKILSKVVKDYFAGKDFTIHKERDVSNTQLRKYAGLDTEEITYFRQFLDTFSKTSYKENILAAWVKEFPETKPAPLKVVLADHWASKKKKVVQKAIDEAFTKVKFSKDIDICIFGLGSERGNVVSGILEGALPSEDISYVNADAYNYSIGVPLSFREGSSSLDKATQSKVLEDIIKTIQNIFNDFVIAKEDTHELLA